MVAPFSFALSQQKTTELLFSGFSAQDETRTHTG